MGTVGQHQLLLTYGQSGADAESLSDLALSAGTTIGSSSDYTNPAVGLDGSIFVRAPSNEAKSYLIADRSSTPNETYTIGAFGFTPVARITQRAGANTPRTVWFWNFGGEVGFFKELGDGSYVSEGLDIDGTRGIIWTGDDTGYGGADTATGLIAYKFDISANSKTAVDSPLSNPLCFVQDHAPGSNIYCIRSTGAAFLYIDTADDSLNAIATLSPAMLTPTLSCLIASDGFMYGLRSHSGTIKLERFNVSTGTSVAEASLGSPAVSDYIFESPGDGRLWVRMSYLSAVRMVGFNKTTLALEAYSESIIDGVSFKIPLGFTSAGLLALTGTDGGSLVYYTLDCS